MGIRDIGRKTVTTAGTPVRLSDLELPVVERVTITALPGNQGSIYVGTQDVSGVSGNEKGWKLDVLSDTGGRVTFKNQQLFAVWIDATVNGEGVHWGSDND